MTLNNPDQRDIIVEAIEQISGLMHMLIGETEPDALTRRRIRKSLDTVARLNKLLTGEEELPVTVLRSPRFEPYLSPIDKRRLNKKDDYNGK